MRGEGNIKIRKKVGKPKISLAFIMYPTKNQQTEYWATSKKWFYNSYGE